VSCPKKYFSIPRSFLARIAGLALAISIRQFHYRRHILAVGSLRLTKSVTNASRRCGAMANVVHR
jgi:hypothetical protein